MSRTHSVYRIKTFLENVKYMLLIAKYSETLILKTTQYWDGFKNDTRPRWSSDWSSGKLESSSLLYARVSGWVQNGEDFEADSRVWCRVVDDGGTRPCNRVEVIEWTSSGRDGDTRPGGRVVERSGDAFYSTRVEGITLVEWLAAEVWSGASESPGWQYSTSGSSILIWSDQFHPIRLPTAPNHLKTT